MIVTDKYEGHTPAPWLPTHDLVETEAKYGGTFTQVINHDGWRVWVGEKDTDVPHLQNSRFGSENLGEADAQLIADAPLLLAEVKRLYALISHVAHKLEYYFDDDADSYLGLNLLETMYYGDDEE